MPLTFSANNILQFYTFISPIFISSFLLLKSTMDYNIRGVIYLVGLLVNYITGMGIKSIFHNYDSTAVSQGRKGQFQRTPVRKNWPINPGQTANSIPDYCSIFEGPWYNNTLTSTSMPSMNAMFHAFTFAYILMGISDNPNHPGIPFIIILGITAILNMFYRQRLYCDKMVDIVVGIVLGAIIGLVWYFIIKSWNPSYIYYGKDDGAKQCKLGKQKFRCSYA